MCSLITRRSLSSALAFSKLDGLAPLSAPLLLPVCRRARWHAFWTGPKATPESRQLVVRWLHPVLVGATGAGDLIPVVRDVEAGP
jgi:hypothetical protein